MNITDMHSLLCSIRVLKRGIYVVFFSAILNLACADEKYERLAAFPYFAGLEAESGDQMSAVTAEQTKSISSVLAQMVPAAALQRSKIVRTCQWRSRSSDTARNQIIGYSAIVRIDTEHEKVAAVEFRLDFSAQGKVVNHVDLPVFDANGKIRLAPWHQVEAELTKHGFDQASWSLVLEYSPKAKSLVWIALTERKLENGIEVVSVGLRADDAQYVETVTKRLPH